MAGRLTFEGAAAELGVLEAESFEKKIQLTHRGTVTTTAASSATNSVTSGTFTPEPYSTVVAIVGLYTGNTTATLSIDDTFDDHGGEDWQELTNAQDASGYRNRTAIYWRRVGYFNQAGAITVTRTAGTVDQWLTATFLEVANVVPSLVAMPQTTSAVGTSAATTATFGSALTARSLVLTGAMSFSDTSPVVPTGYSTFVDLDNAPTNSTSFTTAYIINGGSTSVNWTSLGTVANSVVAIEFLEWSDTRYGVVGLHGDGNNDEYVGGFGDGRNYPMNTGGEIPFDTRTTRGYIDNGGGSYSWGDYSGFPVGPYYDWDLLKPILDEAAAGLDYVVLHGFSAGGAVAIEALRNGWVPPDGILVGAVLDDAADAWGTESNATDAEVALYGTYNGATWNSNDLNGFDVLAKHEAAFGVTRKKSSDYGGPTNHAPMTRTSTPSGPYATPEELAADFWDPLVDYSTSLTVVANVVTAASTVPSPTVRLTKFTESFNKANSTTLGPDLSWTELGGATSLEVVSNQLRDSSAPGGYRVAIAAADVSTADMYAECDLVVGTTATNLGGVGVRMDPGTNFQGYYFGFYGGTAEIWRFNSGGSYSLVSQTSHSWAVGTYRLKLTAIGSQITAYIDGVQVLSTTDTTYSTGQYGGVAMFVNSNNIAIDNFEVGIASTSSQQTVVANLLTASSSVLTPTVTTGSVTVVANAVTASSSVLSPTVVNRQIVVANVITASSSVLNPAVTTGPVTVVANVVTASSTVQTPAAINRQVVVANVLAAASTVLSPTVINRQVVVGNVLATSSTVLNPTITVGSVTVVANVVAASSTVPSPTIINRQIVVANAVTASSSVLTPTVTTGSVTVVANAVTASSSVLTPTVAPGSVTVVANAVTAPATVLSPRVYYVVAANVVAATSSILNPTVTVGSVTVVANVVTASSSVLTPTVSLGATTSVANLVAAPSTVLAPQVYYIVAANVVTASSTVLTPQVNQVVAANAVTASSSVLNPTVAPGSVTVVANSVAATSSILSPTVAPGSVTIVVNVVNSSSSILSPTVTVGSVTIVADVLTAPATVLEPRVSTGETLVVANLLSAPSTVQSPTVTVGAVTVVVEALSAPSTVYTPTLAATQTITVPVIITAGYGSGSYGEGEYVGNVLDPTVTIEDVTFVVDVEVLSAPSTIYSPQVIYYVTAPVVAASSSVFAPTVTTITTVVVPAVSASSSVLSPAVSQTVKPNVLSTSSTIFNPAVTPGAVTVVANLVTASSTVQAPTVTTGSTTVVANVLAAPATVRTPAVAPGSVTVSANTVTAASTVLSPQVYYVVQANKVTASSSVLSPTVTTGSVTVVANVITAASTVYQPTVGLNSTFIASQVVTAASTVYNPTVTVGSVTVSANLVAAPSAVLTPSVARVITVPVVSAAATVLSPQLFQRVVTNVVTASSSVLTPTVTTSTTIVTPALSTPSTVFQPSVSVGAATIGSETVAAPSTVYTPDVAYVVASQAVGSTGQVLLPTVSTITAVEVPTLEAPSSVLAPTILVGTTVVNVDVIHEPSTVFEPKTLFAIGVPSVVALSTVGTPQVATFNYIYADLLTQPSVVFGPQVVGGKRITVVQVISFESPIQVIGAYSNSQTIRVVENGISIQTEDIRSTTDTDTVEQAIGAVG